MRNASEQFVHWRHNSVALPQVLLNVRTLTGAGEFDYPPFGFPWQIFCNRQPVTCDAFFRSRRSPRIPRDADEKPASI
jgi:hypothetical protein